MLAVAGRCLPVILRTRYAGTSERVADTIKDQFLRPGGWVSTLVNNGQQWDEPNGWAPLQWMVYCGISNYGFADDAKDGALRWVKNNKAVYQSTGKLLEKYNVEEVGLVAGPGLAIKAG